MFSPTQADALAQYHKFKFVCIPLNGKVPFFKKWTEITHTPKESNVFDNRNIGILTGKISKLTVLDIDTQDNGVATWNKIKKLYPEFKTPMVATPNKGFHLYFKYNPKLSSTSKLHLNGQTIGWDLLNDGRQATTVPSVLYGKKYKWINSLDDTPLIKMPQWLENYILLLKSN